MSKSIELVGQEIVDLFNEIKDHDNLSRAYGFEEREADIEAKRLSLVQHGCITPVQIVEGPKGRRVIAGNTRIAAAARIVQGRIATETDPGYESDFSFRLPVIVFEDGEIKEERVRAGVDNLAVSQLSDIVLAVIVKKNKEDGISYGETARKLGIKDPNKPGAVVKLLRLPEWFKKAIHNGIVATSVGLFYLDLEGEAKTAVAEALKAAIEKGKGLTLKQCEKIAEGPTEGEGGDGDEGEEDEGKDEGKKPRKVAELTEALETLRADLKSESEFAQSDAKQARCEKALQLLATLKKFVDGTAGYDALLKRAFASFDLD
mgnify:CR=1 FL=1